jgi:hypothetical protein
MFSSAETFTTAAAAGTPVPRAGTFRNLRVKAPAATSAKIEILKNGATTGLTCTLASSNSCNDLVNSVAFAAGDVVSVQASGVGGAKPVIWTVDYQ